MQSTEPTAATAASLESPADFLVSGELVGNNYRDATTEIQRKRSASPHPEADSTSPKKARIEEDVSATEAVAGSQSLSTFKDEDDRHPSTQAGSVHLTSNNEVSIGLDSPREPMMWNRAFRRIRCMRDFLVLRLPS